MEAEAKHDFQATAEDELSFPKNAILKVRKRCYLLAVIYISASAWFSIHSAWFTKPRAHGFTALPGLIPEPSHKPWMGTVSQERSNRGLTALWIVLTIVVTTYSASA